MCFQWNLSSRIVDCAGLNELKLRAVFLVIILILFPVSCYFPSRLSPCDLPPVIDLLVEIFPFIFPLRMVCLNSSPLGFCLFAIAFRICYLKWTDWQFRPLLAYPSGLNDTLLNSKESWSAPVSSTQITDSDLNGQGTHWRLWHSRYNKAWPVIICI